jgi:hypothetical protein
VRPTSSNSNVPTLHPRWRQFVCRFCNRLISEFRPSGDISAYLPVIEPIDSCAVCAKAPRHDVR